MSSNIVLSHKSRVQEAADRYESEGYDVTVEPSRDELPAFLRPFHPDIIAVRQGRSVAVEVRSANKIRRLDYWREFAEAVKHNPQWHLELISSPSEIEASEAEALSQTEILSLLHESEQIERSGVLNASLLLAWSAAEAAIRIVLERYNVESPDVQPAALISRSFTDGLLGREEYDFLLYCMRKRNTIAHGFRQDITAEDLSKLRQVTQDLLDETNEV